MQGTFYIVVASLILLAILSYSVSGKLLFPPIAFNLSWLLVLCVLWVRGAYFYALSDTTLMICMVGASSFTLGGCLGLTFDLRPKQTVFTPHQKRITQLVWLCVLASPVFALWLIKLTGTSNPVLFVAAARAALLASDKTLLFTAITNICYFSIPVAMLALIEREGHQKRAKLAFFTAFVLNALTGARAGLVILFLSCFAIFWLKDQKITRKMVLSAAGALVLVFGFFTALTGRGDTDLEEGFADNAKASGEVLALYVGAQTVAFDRVVRDPRATEHNEQITAPFMKVLGIFGVKSDAPDLGPGYVHWVHIGPYRLSTNAYTMYFAYYEYGFPGIILLSGFVGSLSTVAYRYALAGHKIGMMLWGLMFSATVLSIFSEYFFNGIPFMVRCLIVAWVAYGRASVRSQSLEPNMQSVRHTSRVAGIPGGLVLNRSASLDVKPDDTR